MRRQTELPPLPPKTRMRGRKPHDPRFDVREALYYATGVDLTAIEGIDEIHALTLVSELGTRLQQVADGEAVHQLAGSVSQLAEDRR